MVHNKFRNFSVPQDTEKLVTNLLNINVTMVMECIDRGNAYLASIIRRTGIGQGSVVLALKILKEQGLTEPMTFGPRRKKYKRNKFIVLTEKGKTLLSAIRQFKQVLREMSVENQN